MLAVSRLRQSRGMENGTDFKRKKSQKHADIMLTPLNPTLYSKKGVYRGKHYFSYFC